MSFTSYTSPPATGSTKENLDPTLNLLAQMETPVYDSIGRSTTTSRTFQWLEEELNPAAQNAYVEGFGFTDTPAAGSNDDTLASGGAESLGDNRYRAPTSRRSGDTQIFAKKVQVTGTEMATDAVRYQNKNRMDEQIAMSGLELKRDVEHAIMGTQGDTNYDGTPTNTPSATVPRFITNYWSQIATATSITSAGNWAASSSNPAEGNVNALAEDLYGTGGLTYKMGNAFVENANLLVMHPTNKRNFDEALDAKSNTRREVGNMVSVQGQNFTKYASSFGDFAVVPDQFSVNTNVAMLNPQNWKWITLRPTQVKDIATIGDSIRKMIVMEGGLMHRHQSASGQIAGITQA